MHACISPPPGSAACPRKETLKKRCITVALPRRKMCLLLAVRTWPILPRGRGYAKGIRRRPSVVAEAAATARFFADEGITYETLGLHHEVVTALKQLQLPRPAHIQACLLPCFACVQALTAPVLLTGKNAVVAAETGSGKTLAYVAPIASMLLRQKRRQATSARPFQFHALVLLPNGPLCQQLVSVVQSLRDTTGQTLLTAAQVNSSNPPPQEPPDFITATPAGLLTLLEEAGPAYGKLWTLEGLQTRVKHVVLDEADLLMTAAYSRALNRLLQVWVTAGRVTRTQGERQGLGGQWSQGEALRSGDRRLVEAKLFTELQLSEGEFARLPRKLQVAAWTGSRLTAVQACPALAPTGGSSALLAAGYRPPEPPAPDAQFGPYWRRQYVFVAATMPAVTLHDVGTQIEKLYPDAEWVATPSLHTSKTQVEHAWQQVSDADCVKHLLKAVCDDPDYRAGKAKTLVFVNDIAQADHVSQLFQENQISHEVYHKKLDSASLKLSLERMKSSESGVMISTDASSRGIDIPDVTHIVQAECAPNAIAFLHRVGRTGRAGKQGKVTTLYREENLPLVEVLKQFIAEGRPLEAAFSRNRSFSKKYSRMGDTFVPRGMSSSTFKSLMSAPAPLVKAMGDKKSGLKARCAGAQKAREVMARRRAAEAEAKAQAGAAEAEALAQADAGAYEARLHQLQADLQKREQQVVDTQRLQHLQQQLQDLQKDELQRKEQQVAEQQQQLQQQQADMHLREQQLAQQQHQVPESLSPSGHPSSSAHARTQLKRPCQERAWLPAAQTSATRSAAQQVHSAAPTVLLTTSNRFATLSEADEQEQQLPSQPAKMDEHQAAAAAIAAAAVATVLRAAARAEAAGAVTRSRYRHCQGHRHQDRCRFHQPTRQPSAMCSERAVHGGLLPGLLMRSFLTELNVTDAVTLNLGCRNLYLQLCRDLPAACQPASQWVFVPNKVLLHKQRHSINPTSSAPSTPQPVASLSPDDPILIDQEPAPSSIRRGHKTAVTEAKQKELQAKYPWCRFSGGCNERGTLQAHCSTCLEHKPNSSLFAKASGGGGAVTCEAELAQHAKSKAHSEAIGMAQRAGGGASSIKAAVKAATTTVVQGTPACGAPAMPHDFSAARYFNAALYSISRTLLTQQLAAVRASPYFSLLADSSTDVGTEDHLLLYVRYLEPSSFIYHTSFLCAVKVVGATSEHITAVILRVIDTLSLDVGKFVAFCSVGASTFMGAHNGVMGAHNGVTGAHNGGKRARKKSKSESMSEGPRSLP
ncbi:hypothetical protein QJQ45_027441 [Haematococcus lacustris]|nr:hypothetical protein QJQ45_027441 [Haematococcus lacustris]